MAFVLTYDTFVYDKNMLLINYILILILLISAPSFGADLTPRKEDLILTGGVPGGAPIQELSDFPKISKARRKDRQLNVVAKVSQQGPTPEEKQDLAQENKKEAKDISVLSPMVEMERKRYFDTQKQKIIDLQKQIDSIYSVHNHLGIIKQKSELRMELELVKLSIDIPLPPGSRPSCAYLEAYFKKYGRNYIGS